ncbi:hypothetical protein GCM10020000_43130 [Streptomyces olivoverticillatus]
MRAALWLEAEVGEGEIFKKNKLREAFPEDSQIDRRVRELRDYGWQIDTSRDDPSLKQDEQRYVKKGAEIWVPGQAKRAKHKEGISRPERVRVFTADNNLCRTCGIGVGEEYGDGGLELAKFDVARRKVLLADGTVDYQYVTECNRCRVSSKSREVDLSELLARVQALAPLERKVLTGWIEADRRTLSALEKLWGIYRTLPADARAAFIQAVTGDNE